MVVVVVVDDEEGGMSVAGVSRSGKVKVQQEIMGSTWYGRSETEETKLSVRGQMQMRPPIKEKRLLAEETSKDCHYDREAMTAVRIRQQT